MDAIIICVPTPPDMNRGPGVNCVFDTARRIAMYPEIGLYITRESTTYPGTTDEYLRAILEEKGLRTWSDFLLELSPEREDPNDGNSMAGTIPKVVGGFNEESLSVAMVYEDYKRMDFSVFTCPVVDTRNLIKGCNFAKA